MGHTARVLHLVHSDQRRGAEVFASQLARHLQGEGLESAVCILHSSPGPGLALDGVRAYLLDGGRQADGKRVTLGGPKLWGLRRALAEFQPDVVLAHGSTSLRYGALSRLYLRGLKAIYRNIGMASFWAGPTPVVQANRLLLRAFDLVVSLSDRARQDFLRVYHLPPQRVAVIPNGIDAGPFSPLPGPEQREACRRSLGLSRQDFALICVGGLSPEKGQEELLYLLREVRGRAGSVRLLLVGDGPLRRALEQNAAGLGVADSVRFLGVRDDVPALLAAADLFVLPSRSEGIPGALIEAGMAGLCAVACDVGAVSDVVRDGVTGIVVRPGDRAAFREAVIRLALSPLRRKAMGAAARERCLRHFDMARVAGMYRDLLLALLDGRAP